MKLILFLIAIPLIAQNAVLTPALPTSVTAGTTFQMTVAASSGPSNMAGYQFTLALPAGISLTRCQSLIASKQVSCPAIPAAGLTGTVKVLLFGMNSSGLIDGPTVRLYLKAARPLLDNSGTFALTNTVVTSGDAHTIPSSGRSVRVPFMCNCASVSLPAPSKGAGKSK